LTKCSVELISTALENTRASLQTLAPADPHDAVLLLRLYLLDGALDLLRLADEDDYEIWRHFYGA
jgi:hypothetical protein